MFINPAIVFQGIYLKGVVRKMYTDTRKDL